MFNNNQPQQQTNLFQANQPQQSSIFQANTQQQFNVQPVANQAQQLHMNNIDASLAHIYSLQNNQSFQHLIQFISFNQQFALEQLNKATDQTDIKHVNAQQFENLNKRSLKIKQKNQQLMLKLLYAKGKLERLMYHTKGQNNQVTYESMQILDKIRNMKGQMSQKCLYLKSLKIQKGQFNQKPQQIPVYSNATATLNQLKKAAQILDKEVIKNKIEMEQVLRYTK